MKKMIALFMITLLAAGVVVSTKLVAHEETPTPAAKMLAHEEPGGPISSMDYPV